MRRAAPVTVWLMVGAFLAPGRAGGQAALTPIDSAILTSQPLKRLVLAPSFLRRVSLLAAVTPRPCPPATTLAVWHNHPWVGPDSSFGVRTPEDLCSLSQPDLRTVVADSIPFAVVSVGRAAQPIVCWWRGVQAVVNRHVKL